MTGIVGNQWSFDSFAPMEAIPSAVGLTVYTRESPDIKPTPHQHLAQQIAPRTLEY